ncbi:MAG: glycoside hydrolase family 127 protein [Bacteroidales bacterium]|nr:glycoside hydrolase family 127 protein [Bacteroidales bacterium]
MKKVLLFLSIILLSGSCSRKSESPLSSDYPVKPVSFKNVRLTDHFWLPRLETNRKVTIPYDFKKCEETNRIDNFSIAGGVKKGSFKGIRYNDSDVFKVMEGAAYSLSTFPDEQLETYMDRLIGLVAAAQEDDGYLYTARTINPDTVISNAGEKRWSLLKQSHELYNIGHMYEAAVAYYEATGKRNLLEVALKSADLVCRVFGPNKDQLHDVPGHQEIEIGLVKLYRVTGKRKYLDMAKYFLDQRGNAKIRTLYTYGADGSNLTYTQDHMPVVNQCTAEGHAVRAAYMYTGMADIAALTGDVAYKNAVEIIWENVVDKKLYITGGIGAMHSGEAFGPDYFLPNLSAYNETCAAIANIFWNQRMFLLSGDAKYIDVLERTLYNGFLSGVSLDGDRFFYPNPLESDGSHQRSPWFDCSCCPTNVARFLPSLPGYIYAQKENQLFVNLYIGNRAEINMDFGKLNIIQSTNYPWDGTIDIELNPEVQKSFTVMLRIPSWAGDQPFPGDLYRFQNEPEEKILLKINGELVETVIYHGYAVIVKEWLPGDKIQLKLPMPVRKIVAHKMIEDDMDKMAFSRGPLVYCAEGIDNGGKVRNFLIDKELDFELLNQPTLLHGIHTMHSNAYSVSMDSKSNVIKKEQKLNLIPYYAWAHRGNGEMMVWFPYDEKAARALPPPTIASESSPSASYVYDQILALNDQRIPKKSNDQEIPRFTFWNHKGSKEWVRYDFKDAMEISYIHVYWFDDGPDGGCRIPKNWKAWYLENGKWNEVKKNGQYPVFKDGMNTIEIAPVKTKSIKLEIEL